MDKPIISHRTHTYLEDAIRLNSALGIVQSLRPLNKRERFHQKRIKESMKVLISSLEDNYQVTEKLEIVDRFNTEVGK